MRSRPALILLGTLFGACAPQQVRNHGDAASTRPAGADTDDGSTTPDSPDTPDAPDDDTGEPATAAAEPLPLRDGPQQETTGSVPHIQVDVDPDPAVVDALVHLAFLLPDVESRPTIVSLPGALGMWLLDEAEIEHPEVIVEGREFAHIHPDGSLHAPLPVARAHEVEATGWGERHPWADDREGWGGFCMLYTPRSMDELAVTFQLVVESYNHVTGRQERPDHYLDPA